MQKKIIIVIVAMAIYPLLLLIGFKVKVNVDYI